MTNPLIEPWETPFGLPPFELIEDSHFEPAAEQAFAAARMAMEAIARSPEAPSFANTIEAMQRADHALRRVFAPFFAIAGTCSTPARDKLMRLFSPQLAAYHAEIATDAELFARVAKLWDTRDDLDLTDEQARLLQVIHRDFLRAGAALPPQEAARLRDIMTELAQLGTQFTQNLLADERDWQLPLSAADLARMPDFLAEALIAAGQERDAGPMVTLSRSVIVPFLEHCPDRALRQTAYEAWTSRGARGGDTDNRSIAAEVLRLRHERAQLLGYENFAQYKLETEMAGTPGTVRDFLHDIWTPARAAAEADAELLTTRLRADGHDGPLAPWDWHFYTQARRKEELSLDEAELKPYFQLDHMIEAMFDVAGRLFGLAFSPIDVPLYHADCRAWEVTRDGAHIAVFIGDYFARAGKRSGAWCSAIRAQERMDDDLRPHVVNVCNFARPQGDHAALLSHDDARTLFHEFGHALHQMLSDVTYERLSGTSVARDFVELPSQLYECWLDQPALLDRYARHAETGDPIPAALRDRLLAASSFDSGFATVEYLASALVDLEFHDGPPPADPMQMQAQILEEIAMPAAIRMRHATPHFAHVFAGDGYAAGYYSYMWSQVMDADAFDAFLETGDLYDPDTAQRLEDAILSRGGTAEAAELYTRFRGRLPGTGPLLKRLGVTGR